MSKRPLHIGLTQAALMASVLPMLWATPTNAHAAAWEFPYPKLGACTRFDSTAFKTIAYTDWSSAYHGNVGRVIENAIGQLAQEKLAIRKNASGPRNCISPSDPAPAGLATIATTLEPWEGSVTTFERSDTAPVLLEYLRVYECSLAERSLTLPIYIWREEVDRRQLLPGGIAANPFVFPELLKIWSEQATDIRRELRISRPTLERALGLVGTLNLTRVMENDAECIQRTSLDIRNAFALSADVAACFPRIWNAKDPLRDPPVCSDKRDNDKDGDIDLEDEGCTATSDMSE